MCKWTDWSDCTGPCGGTGKKTRMRIPEDPFGCKGGGDVEHKSCKKSQCNMCNWGPWGSCNKICDGTKTRTRIPEDPFGCKGGGDVEHESCGPPCPMCNLNSWGDCIGPCGGTEKKQEREYGGILVVKVVEM